ncbi:TonB-dependent receptor [Sphingobium aquiterrae]|uniref:TonB-dependent receptor plug domain-containing protein n=1 Tax=Sphingobium aquiterrae TaxID=2038656 RepID=UPI0030194335
MPANSDTAALQANGADEGEAIVITGSRLPNTGLTSSAPVNILNAAQIKATGATNVGELLRTLPAATSTSGEGAGRGNSGTATVGLRGLGAINTLVLINGRRVLASSGAGTVDLNSIPFAAIERVEVLQDGASAIYGSDAIAGVVNLIMRKSYDGLMLTGYYGISSRGDLPTRQIDLTMGHEWDRGGFMFSGSWRKSDGNLMADRPISRDVDWRDRGGRNQRNPLPTTTAFTGINPANPSAMYIIKEGVQQATSLADFRPYVFPGTNDPLTSGNDGINFFKYTSAASDISTINAFLNAHYEVTDNITAFVEASYNRRKSFGFLTADSIGPVYNSPVIVAADNIYNPFGVAVSANRTLIEETSRNLRQNNIRANTFRIIAGLEGKLFSSWKWDTSFNYQHLDQYNFLGRGVILSKIRQAAGGPATCNFAVDGCVPINLFGATGSVTPDMLNFITADSNSYGTSSLRSAVANLSGPLFDMWAGTVNLAVGAEYREETYTIDYDPLSEKNLFVSRTLSPDAFPPTRKIKEVYAELGVPLVRDLPLIHSLDLEAAVRYSDYNMFGSTTNPKIGIKWRPVSDLLIRGTYGTGFRAPTFTEAFGGQTNGFSAITDPCLSSTWAQYPGCGGRRAVTTSNGAFILSGGNPDLRPETAKNFTVGAVYSPSFVPGLALTVDLFKIKKENIIGSPNVNYLILQNALNGSYADRITRDAQGGITQVIAVRDNLLDQQIKGIDAQLVYATSRHSWGKLNFQGNVTYIDSFKQSPAAGVPMVEVVGNYNSSYGTLSRFRGNALLTWSLDNLSVSYNGRFVGAVTNTGSLLVNGENLRADHYIQHDLQLRFDIDQSDMSLTFGVRNVLDKMPPFLEGNFDAAFDASSFNSAGRFFYTSVSKKF